MLRVEQLFLKNLDDREMWRQHPAVAGPLLHPVVAHLPAVVGPLLHRVVAHLPQHSFLNGQIV